MIYFLLCAYNEEKNICEVICSIYQNFLNKEIKIIVVDDGSVDCTKNIVNDLKSKLVKENLILLQHKKNLGLGSAIKTGIEYLLDIIKTGDIIVTLDADNTHPIEITKSMITKILDNNDIVIASRYEIGARQVGVNIIRRFISYSAKVLLKKFFNIPNVKDYTSGYRAYKAEIIKKAKSFYKDNFVQEKDFVVQLEILYNLSKFNPKIVEVPLILRYEKKYGKSKLKIVKNILRYFYFIFKTKFL